MKHKWGTSRVVYEDGHIILVRATAVGGNAASSWHYHAEHVNAIHVLAGQLTLSSYEPGIGNDVLQVETMLPGDCAFLLPEVKHRIQFEEPCEFLEWYSANQGATLSLDDIFRIEPGIDPHKDAK